VSERSTTQNTVKTMLRRVISLPAVDLILFLAVVLLILVNDLMEEKIENKTCVNSLSQEKPKGRRERT